MEDKKISNGYYAQQRCICFSICFANTVLVKESTSAVSPGIQPLATSFKDLNTTVALLCYKLLLVFFFFFSPCLFLSLNLNNTIPLRTQTSYDSLLKWVLSILFKKFLYLLRQHKLEDTSIFQNRIQIQMKPCNYKRFLCTLSF